MVKVRLVTPTQADLRYLADHLRESDKRELFAVHGPDYDLFECLHLSVAVSDEARVAVTCYGEPIAVFGVAEVHGIKGTACPWMLGTDAMELYGREIVALSRQHVAKWGQQYTRLFNFVDARNTRSIKWLKRTGFTFRKAQPYGVEGALFHLFERCT